MQYIITRSYAIPIITQYNCLQVNFQCWTEIQRFLISILMEFPSMSKKLMCAKAVRFRIFWVPIVKTHEYCIK